MTPDLDAHAERLDQIRDSAEKHLTLGDLRQAFSAFGDQSLPVVDDRGRGIDGTHSYRGYYDHLAIEPGPVGSLGALDAELADANGKTFSGHKGGDYTMGPNTPVWISYEGEASGLAVVGVVRLDDHVVLVTEEY